MSNKTAKRMETQGGSVGKADENLIDRYVDAIYPRFSKEFAELVRSYYWHPSWRDTTPNAEETLSGRLNMVREWRKNSRKATVAVEKWGRLKFPGNARNLDFCKKDADPIEIVSRTCKGGSSNSGSWGMATWTKILTVAHPEEHYIFDSRVSCALNDYCAASKVPLPYYFPNLQAKTTSGRNGRKHPRNIAQEGFIDALKIAQGAEPVPGCAFLYFSLYCPLVEALAAKFSEDSAKLEPIYLFEKNQLDRAVREENINNAEIGFDFLPHLVEMALFMQGRKSREIVHSGTSE